MKPRKTIAQTNKHLKNKIAASKMLEKSVLSSSAVEGIHIKSLNNKGNLETSGQSAR